MHYAVIDQLNRGIHITDFELYTHAVTPGRFREENDLDVYVRNGTSEAHMLFAKVFRGRKPWYKPWFELFGIDATVTLNSTAAAPPSLVAQICSSRKGSETIGDSSTCSIVKAFL